AARAAGGDAVSGCSTFLETLATHSREVCEPRGRCRRSELPPGCAIGDEFEFEASPWACPKSTHLRSARTRGAIVLQPAGREVQRSKLTRAFCASLSPP